MTVIHHDQRTNTSSLPVWELIDAAERLAEGDLSARVPPVPGGPMGRVVRSFNGMAERLDQASGQRRRMMADLSHELATPLTVIQGGLEAMIDGVRPLNEAQLISLQEEARLMVRPPDDLRTLSMTKSGELRLEHESVEMIDLLTDAATPYRHQSSIGWTVASDPGPVTCDPVRIHQVLTNLITNALRAMPAGGSLTLQGVCDDEGWRVEVTDSGIGLEAEEVATMFDRFVRSSESHGAGLGLSIARELVRAYGGQFGADSAPGEGTNAWFTLPGNDTD